MAKDITHDPEWLKRHGLSEYIGVDRESSTAMIKLYLTPHLLLTIDTYAHHVGTNRNAWITEALEALIEAREPTPCLVTAEQLMGTKLPLIIRISHELNDLLYGLAAEREVSRQILTTDACLSRIAKAQ